MADSKINIVFTTCIFTLLACISFSSGVMDDECDSSRTDYFECVLKQNEVKNLCSGRLDKCVCTYLHVRCSGSAMDRLDDIYPFLTNTTKSVTLTNGVITELPSDLFDALYQNDPNFNLYELEALDLSNNTITTIGDGAFKRLRNLKALDLSHNMFLMNSFSAETFSGLESLENLKLNNVTDTAQYLNLLEVLVRSSVYQLTHLELANNGLTTFTEAFNTFLCSNDRLNYLNLSYNQISNMDVPSCMLNLVILDLSNNDFESLSLRSMGVLDHFMNLVDLRLGSNPYDCSCYIGDTARWLNLTELPLDFDSIRCRTSTSDSYVGSRVRDVNFEDVCEPPEIVICRGISVAKSSMSWILIAGALLVAITLVSVVVMVMRKRRGRQSRGPAPVTESPVYTRMV